jgi:Trk K+ transport system NAD-binding subunit
MTPLARRALFYTLVLALTTALFTAVYSLGMAHLEERPRAWYQALEVVIQSFTTTGYGEDAPWATLRMNLLMIVMQLTGIGFILSAVDIFVVPWLKQTLQPNAPTEHPVVEDHVVICGHTDRTEVFIKDLAAKSHPYVLLVPDREEAARLHEEGYTVVAGSPESVPVLHRVHIGRARALVSDVADDVNASITLAAREAHAACTVITFVKDIALARYHRAAGADTVLSPRQLVGTELGVSVRNSNSGPATVIVAGYGDSGQAACMALQDTKTTLTVLDIDDQPGVDVVGDARTPDVLEEAGIAEADALVVTLGNDTTATFTTLIARSLRPDLTIVVRADANDMTENLRRAGADSIRSLDDVSGHMLTEALFSDDFTPPGPYEPARKLKI